MPVALLAVLLAAVVSPPAARLCIGLPGTDLMSGQCVDALVNEVEVEPAPRTRSWIWMDAARTTFAVGNVAPDAAKIVVDPKPSAFVTVRGSRERSWPADTTFAFKSAIDSWAFTLPRDAVVSLRGMAIPDGSYVLTVHAPHHLPFERRALKVTRATPSRLGRIDLKPMPRLLGRFIDRQGGPIADVAVSAPEGALLATSDPAGSVREEVREALPLRLFVRAAGFGHRAVEVTRSESDFDFGTVTLTPGATLTINLDRNGYDGPLTASLIRPGEHTVGQRTTFESRTAPRVVSVIELRDVEAREYVLLLRGESPLQVMRQEITIAEHENATKDIRLEPRMVKGLLHQGNVAIAKTSLRFVDSNGEWSSTATTDDEGHFQSDAWQEGHVNVTVDRPPEPHYSSGQHIGGGDSEWDIEIPDRRIRGIVVDKATGAPVLVRMVTLSWKRGDSSGMHGVPAGDDGRFELTMLDPGHYEFTASDPSYLDAVAAVDLRPEDHERDVRLELQHGHEVRVKVVSADGTPVESAVVIIPRAALREMPRSWTTDASGVATLLLESEAPLPAWVVSPVDSFAFVTILAETKPQPARIVLPPANAAIVVRAQRDDGTPVPHVHVFFAYNGVLVPFDVRDYFTYHRVRMLTGSDGSVLLTHMPAGEYDFFALETPEENVMVTDPAYFGAPAHVSMLPGENTVALRVKARQARNP